MLDDSGSKSRITVLLADDNLIVREGVRAIIEMEDDLEVVGTAGDYPELIATAEQNVPQVVVTDIRMPPTFQREGIDAAQYVRKINPGTGIVILSQYDEPEFAIALLSGGSAGFAYLLKDRVAEADELVRAIRAVAAGSSMLDPSIVDALVAPVTDSRDLAPAEHELLQMIAEGRPIKAIAAAQQTTAGAAAQSVDRLFAKVAEQASTGTRQALRRLEMFHQAMVELEERGESLSRFVPKGLADKLRVEGTRVGETERQVVTVLMSDVRGYSTISERSDPSVLATQLNEHRAEMNRAVAEADGTVMSFGGDSVMAVFGASRSDDDHADKALLAARAMQAAQADVNGRWVAYGLPAFELGIGLSTGEVAAVLLGSEDRLEYTIIGDTVNLAQRIQQWARSGEIVVTEPTYAALQGAVEAERLEPALVKGREALVTAYRIGAVAAEPRPA
jgi:class 3 adenylate cyclase/ActR/RegA family two-component response regulator